MRLLLPALFATLLSSTPVWAESAFKVLNESHQAIKVVAPGGGAVIKKDAPETTVTFQNDDANGTQVNAWFVRDPKQLCVIFVRWDGVLKVSGTNLINCRAH